MGKNINKNQLRLKTFRFLKNFGPKVYTKFKNICEKTGQYNVPSELFQKRTHRKNRVLISWKTVNRNNLTVDQLKTFAGGVTVEFVNNDFFDKNNQKNPTFVELKNKLGSNEVVSSIITIRSESGSSSSQDQREAFIKLKTTQIKYLGKDIILNEDNYKDYAIEKVETGGIGNEKWKGFLFVSIKGGQQDTVESHPQKKLTIFNPACEYANFDVSNDISLVMSYFALFSIDESSLKANLRNDYKKIKEDLENALKLSEYDNETYSGNLLDYCKNHMCLNMENGKLFDPIQAEEIKIHDFSIDDKADPANLDITHNEAVSLDHFYWDKKKSCILSPARPTNIFWSKHLSNMMQQDYSLDDYFKHLKEIFERYNNYRKKKNAIIW